MQVPGSIPEGTQTHPPNTVSALSGLTELSLEKQWPTIWAKQETSKTCCWCRCTQGHTHLKDNATNTESSLARHPRPGSIDLGTQKPLWLYMALHVPVRCLWTHTAAGTWNTDCDPSGMLQWIVWLKTTPKFTACIIHENPLNTCGKKVKA